MPITVAELKNIITVDMNPLKAGAAEATSILSNLGNTGSVAFAGLSTAALGSIAAMAAVAGAVAAVGKAAFDAAVSFDEASDKIRVSTGATGESLAGLEASFKTVFTSIPTDSAKAAEAVSFLAARLHLTGDALTELSTTELELARITGSALAPQLEATTRLFGDWTIQTGEQTKALDFLFKVSQQTAVGVTTLSQELVKFGAPLRVIGFSFQEAATLVGKFHAEGVELNKVLPGLRIALKKMSDEGARDASEAFAALITKIKETDDPMKALGISLEQFGGRAGVDFVEAIKQGRFSIDDLVKTIQGSQETIKQAAKDTEDFGEKWQILKNKAEAALEPLGKTVFDSLSGILSIFTDTGEQIKQRWGQVWKDLGGTTGNGLEDLVVVMEGFVVPFRSVGHRLAEGLVDGFTNAWNAFKGGGFGGVIAGGINAAKPFGGTTIISDQVIQGWKQAADAASKYGFAIDGVKKKVGEATGAHNAHAGAVNKTTEAMNAANKELKEMADRAGKAALFFMNEAVKDMEDLYKAFSAITPPIIEFVDGFEDAAAATKKVADAAKDLIPAEKELEGVVESAGKMIGNTEPYVRAAGAAQGLQRTFEKLSQDLPRAWNTLIDALVRKGSELSVKVKGYANDILNVFNTLPGKWGDSLRKASDEVGKWINFLDAAIKLVQRIMGDDSPSGLGGILKGVSDVFKKTSQDIKDSTSTWSEDVSGELNGLDGAMQTSASGIQGAAGKIVGAFTQIAGAALAFIGAKGQGVVGGAISGALGGIAAAGGIATALGVTLAPLTLGLSALGGALLGGLLGLFKGKSPLQKAQEAAALQKAKDDIKLSMDQVLKSAQDVIQAGIESFQKALDFFDKLDQFTPVRKQKFKVFFANLQLLMDYFLAQAKNWATDGLDKAKAAAEAIGPVADAIAKLPLAFDGISKHMKVPKGQFDLFFRDFSRLMGHFFALAEDWIEGQAKQAQKVADHLAPVINIFGPLIEAIKGMADIEEPSNRAFHILFRSLERFVERIGDMSSYFDKAVLKSIQNFAEKIAPATALWKDVTDAIKATVGIVPVTEADIDAVVGGIVGFTNALIAGLQKIVDSDQLAKAVDLADAVIPIAAALKAWADAAQAIHGYVAIAAEVWDQIVFDFNRGLILLNLLILDAAAYVEKAKTFKDLIDEGAASIRDAITTYATSIASAGSALAAQLPQGGSPIGGPGPTSTGTMSATSRGPVSLTLNLSGDDPKAAAVIRFIQDTFGAGVLDSTASQFA